MRFADKVALVTGGGSGIGQAVVRILVAEGARTVVCDRVGAGIVVAAARDAGGTAIAVDADVTASDQVASLFTAIDDAYGRLDCAVNCAGVPSCYKPLIEQSEEEFDRVININLKGMWRCLGHELRMMSRTGGGAIVNIASALGQKAVPGASEYVASKHAVIGLTRAAALEHAREGIRINAVSPGTTVTGITSELIKNEQTRDHLAQSHPMGRLGHPDEIAKAVVWLLSDDASFATGTIMNVDGGWTAG
jgi:NAD(P)-dependent dehydrogenase (short-subunit alcohol dehydrogenase family)